MDNTTRHASSGTGNTTDTHRSFSESPPHEEDATRTVTNAAGDVPDRDPSSLQPAASLARGACLGRYVVLHALGSGGMGNVYAAYDPELERQVALKILRREPARREITDRWLQREAQALARLSHPHVVSVYDVGWAEGRLFIAMELIIGRTLAAWLAGAEPSTPEILRIFRQAGEGLAAAHQIGLVHRDFKPSNVMLADDGRARVLDFGLATEARPVCGATPEPGARTTDGASGAVRGTPAYMAPEQAEGRQGDARGDQFSFCVALYEALYGDLPWTGHDRGALRADAEAEIRLRSTSDGRVSAWLRRILVRGLAADPAQRFASMRELLDQLGRDPTVTRRRRLVAVACTAALGFGVFGLWRSTAAGGTLCQGSEDRLAGVWDGDRRAETRTAFLATGLPFAEDAWHGLAEILDRRTEAWATMHRAACEATHVYGEQSASLLDRRMECLDLRLRETSALVDLFSRADTTLVGKAAEAADGLTSLAGCADSQALEATPAPPPTDQATTVRALRDHLADTRALESAARYGEALERNKEILADARLAGYPPLVGEALLQLGRAEGRLGNPAKLREHLVAAL
ncbi:MAG: serine/threonine-protein kinase, partial [Acidobacteriota bacterium]